MSGGVWWVHPSTGAVERTTANGGCCEADRLRAIMNRARKRAGRESA